MTTYLDRIALLFFVAYTWDAFEAAGVFVEVPGKTRTTGLESSSGSFQTMQGTDPVNPLSKPTSDGPPVRESSIPTPNRRKSLFTPGSSSPSPMEDPTGNKPNERDVSNETTGPCRPLS